MWIVVLINENFRFKENMHRDMYSENLRLFSARTEFSSDHEDETKNTVKEETNFQPQILIC